LNIEQLIPCIAKVTVKRIDCQNKTALIALEVITPKGKPLIEFQATKLYEEDSLSVKKIFTEIEGGKS
jgi:hypothetical protein